MLNQQLQLKLFQKFSPQQIQLMKLIQLTTLDLEQRIQNEVYENPALELENETDNSTTAEEQTNTLEEENGQIGNDQNDQQNDQIDMDYLDNYLSDDEIPAYKLQSNNNRVEERKERPINQQVSFGQYLLEQIRNSLLNKEEQQVAEFIIGSLDDSGYLLRSNEELLDDLAFTQNKHISPALLRKAIKAVQSVEPAGIGARSLKQCLSLQLARKKETKEVIIAKQVVEKTFDLLSKKNYRRMLQKLHISEQQLKAALVVIEKLNPKPGDGRASEETYRNTAIVPDFVLTLDNESINLSLNQHNAPSLRLSEEYKAFLLTHERKGKAKKANREAALFIKQKLDSARWFIEAIEQRYQTLYKTMSAIIAHQKTYFLTGDKRKLKPMILKDIADKINMDISTISRVANSKYISTPYGTMKLKTFFSEKFKNNDQEDVSSIEIKDTLKSIIDKENKKEPLSDRYLSEALKKKGYIVARRTVAKYRAQLNMPNAKMRREI